VILVVDYGMGNVGSVVNMLGKVGADVSTSANPAMIDRADKLVIPGVGAFDSAMARLQSLGLVESLSDAALRQGKPVLGICLGMQIMGLRSDEGRLPGLRWIDAVSRRLSPAGEHSGLRVPHMGWNEVRLQRPAPLVDALPEEPRFYFVHTYHVCCNDPSDVLLTTDYGGPFVSAFHRGNLYGVQFHPEKSHRFGLTLMRNFVESC
jgi:glutamine amidotransferase